MKKILMVLLATFLALFSTTAVMADSGFYAITNQLGYATMISNTTDGTGPWYTSPYATNPESLPSYRTLILRDMYIYSMFGVAGSPDYNIVMSNWSEHSQSNQNDSFFQLYDNGDSVTGATGEWSSDLKTFSLNVSGSNAPYPWSRAWQPDNGVAWGVTLIDYQYNLTATFGTPAILDSGWYVNSGDPAYISGTFSGTFQVTYDPSKNPITNGDNYSFLVPFDSNMVSPLDQGFLFYNEFGALASVPEPGSLLLLSVGLIGLVGVGRKVQ